MIDPIKELAEEIAEECMKAHKKGIAKGCRLAIKSMEVGINAGASHEEAFNILKDIFKEKFE